LYYGTCGFTEHMRGVSYSRPEGLYYWGYYVGMNAPWVVVPSCEFPLSLFLSLWLFRCVVSCWGKNGGRLWMQWNRADVESSADLEERGGDSTGFCRCGCGCGREGRTGEEEHVRRRGGMLSELGVIYGGGLAVF
jgi:hypothetical protein